MKMIMTAVLSFLFVSPSFADAGGAELVGKYQLKQALSGVCYPEIYAELNNYGAGNDGLGIYGQPGSGEIVFQFTYLNQGSKAHPQTNPMTGETYGVMNTLSVINGGTMEGLSETVNNDGSLAFRRTIKGQYANGTLSFEWTDVNNIVRPSSHEQAACVYTKVN